MYIEFSVDCMITAVISIGLRLALSTTPDWFQVDFLHYLHPYLDVDHIILHIYTDIYYSHPR